MTPLELARRFAGVRQRLSEIERHALDKVGAMVADEAKALIGTEYPGWPALADSTVERKEALGQTGRISATDPLLATGELRATIKHEVSGNRVVIGTEDQVGVYHEFGTSKMPARPFLAPALMRKRKEIAKTVGETLVEAITGRL